MCFTKLDSFLNEKAKEVDHPIDRAWVTQNRNVTVQAILSLHNRLFPFTNKTPFEIVATVESWAYKQEVFENDPTQFTADDSIISMARSEPRNSFVQIREQLFGNDESSERSYECEEQRHGRARRQFFEGATYRLEMNYM